MYMTLIRLCAVGRLKIKEYMVHSRIHSHIGNMFTVPFKTYAYSSSKFTATKICSYTNSDVVDKCYIM